MQWGLFPFIQGLSKISHAHIVCTTSHIPLKLPRQTCMYFLLSVTLLGPLLVTNGENSYPYRDRCCCSTLKWWANASASWHIRKKEWTDNDLELEITKCSLHNNFLLLHFEALNFTCLLHNYIINNYDVPSFERKMKEHDLMLFQKQDGIFYVLHSENPQYYSHAVKNTSTIAQ